MARLRQLNGQPDHLCRVPAGPKSGTAGWSQKNFWPALKLQHIDTTDKRLVMLPTTRKTEHSGHTRNKFPTLQPSGAT